MSQFKKGAAALGALQNGGSEGNSVDSEFAKFGVGTTYKVRVLGTEDLMQYFGYGVYKKVNTFVSKKPSDRDDKGNAIDNLTPWDLAEKHYRDQQFSEKDAGNEQEAKELGQKASVYRGKEKYVMGFVNLVNGEEIVVDFTRNQALEVYATIMKYEKKLGKLAFELSKTNATGQAKDTKVTLTPLIDFEDDLTPEEQANFKKFDGNQFNQSLFDGLLYEADEKTQIENLVAAGFDISLIGLTLDGSGTAQNDDPTEQF
jgi:hypothetical protein